MPENIDYKALRNIVEDAGVKCPAPENCTVYADNRIISFFPRENMSFVPIIPENKKLYDLLTGEGYTEGEKIKINGALGKAFIIED